MKLATSTNIMDADCDRPYRIPVDVSARACARAGYQYVDACLCSYCREGQPLRGRILGKVDRRNRSAERRTEHTVPAGARVLDDRGRLSPGQNPQ